MIYHSLFYVCYLKIKVNIFIEQIGFDSESSANKIFACKIFIIII